MFSNSRFSHVLELHKDNNVSFIMKLICLHVALVSCLFVSDVVRWSLADESVESTSELLPETASQEEGIANDENIRRIVAEELDVDRQTRPKSTPSHQNTQTQHSQHASDSQTGKVEDIISTDKLIKSSDSNSVSDTTAKTLKADSLKTSRENLDTNERTPKEVNVAENSDFMDADPVVIRENEHQSDEKPVNVAEIAKESDPDEHQETVEQRELRNGFSGVDVDLPCGVDREDTLDGGKEPESSKAGLETPPPSDRSDPVGNTVEKADGSYSEHKTEGGHSDTGDNVEVTKSDEGRGQLETAQGTVDDSEVTDDKQPDSTQQDDQPSGKREADLLETHLTDQPSDKSDDQQRPEGSPSDVPLESKPPEPKPGEQITTEPVTEHTEETGDAVKVLQGEDPEPASQEQDVLSGDTPVTETGADDAGKGDKDEEDSVEEIQVPESTEDELPSFDEWKQKMLAEQAEQEKSKTQEVQNPQTVTVSQPKPKQGSKKVNYASATCGAKIRATNNEAQNPGFVLSENKDQYMINPCKAKKWFVVELCTPVKIQALDIGNLELFSSVPESFVIHVSEGFPTKEWKAVGTFHLRDERSVQSFSVDNEQMYAHYVKVEMSSHYGTEHYCPLTVLRVYGLTVIEADEEVDEPEEVEVTDTGEDQDWQDATLFASATDTVLSLVKTVLSHGDEEQDTLQGIVDVKGTGDAVNASNQNATIDSTQQQQQPQMEPCVPDVSTGHKDIDPITGEAQPKAPDAIVLEPGHGSGGPEGDIDTEPEIVTLIQKPATSLKEVLDACLYCTSERLDSYFDAQTVCGYYRCMCYVYPMCCLHSEPPRQSTDSDPPEPHEDSLVMPSPSISTPLDIEDTKHVASTDEVIEIKPTAVIKESQVPDTQDIGQDLGIPLTSVTQGVSVEILPSIPVEDQESMRQQNLDATPIFTPPLRSEVIEASVSAVPDPVELLQTRVPESGCTEGSSDISTGCLVGPDVIQIRPTQTEQVVATETNGADEKSEPTLKDVTEPSDEGPEDGPVEADPGQKNGLRDIYAEEPLAGDDMEFEPAPVQAGDDVQYQKLITGRKETTFMKLKNKIKELELNLNLSSRYLEELSQRYRRQMEEMYVSLNKTITMLSNTARTAEERDLKQQDNIARLEAQIEHLSSRLNSVTNDVTDITMQVIERHLYLMMIEATIFLLVLAWCLNRQEKKFNNWFKMKGRSTPVTMTTTTLHHDPLVRRSSASDTPPRERSSSTSALVAKRTSYDDCDIRKSGSKNELKFIPPTTLGTELSPGRPWEIPKKKKRKGSLQKSLQFGTSAHPPKTTSSGSGVSQDCTPGGDFTQKGPGIPSKQHHKIYDRKTSGDSRKEDLAHRRNGSDETVQTSFNHITNRGGKSSQSLSHRKTPSLDANIYGALSVNGNADSEERPVAHNGYVDDLGPEINGRPDRRK